MKKTCSKNHDKIRNIKKNSKKNTKNNSKKIVKSLVAINTNCIENKKELSKINKNKLKINPIKIKESLNY